MFSSSENYCRFVHKRYDGLVEGRFFDTRGNARMILSVGNKLGPKKYGCSEDCDLGAFVKYLSHISVAPGLPSGPGWPLCCCYCKEQLERTMRVKTDGRVTQHSMAFLPVLPAEESTCMRVVAWSTRGEKVCVGNIWSAAMNVRPKRKRNCQRRDY